MTPERACSRDALGCSYAEITAFLRETEDYLNTLTKTIMEKKITEASEAAFNTALSEARGNGLTEEAAQQMAVQAAKAAADESEFARINENLSGDAQVPPFDDLWTAFRRSVPPLLAAPQLLTRLQLWLYSVPILLVARDATAANGRCCLHVCPPVWVTLS